MDKFKLLRSAKWLMLLTALILCTGSLACAMEFSYERTTKMGAKTTTSKRYQKGMISRQEESGGHIIIVRPDKHVAWALMTETKTYYEQTLPRDIGTKTEAAQLAELAKTKPGIKKVGSETIDGYVCDEYKLDQKKMAQGQSKGRPSPEAGTALVWVSPKLGVVLKAVTDSPKGKVTAVVTNIKVRKLPDSLFEIPAGYKKQEMPNMSGMKGMQGMKGMKGMPGMKGGH
jgi:hypothetical protein